MSAPEPDQVGAQPWSPFPVQDWSRLPATRCVPSAPDPSWPPPPDRRRWWVPLVVLLASGPCWRAPRTPGWPQFPGPSDGGSGLSAAATPPWPTSGSRRPRPPGSRFTPAATESAILSAAAALQSTDLSFTSRALEVDDYEHLRIWRTVSTPVESAAGDQTTRLYEVRGPVVLRGESGPAVGYAYRPGLVELPAAVAPGQTWSSEGTAGADADLPEQLPGRRRVRTAACWSAARSPTGP